MPWFVLVTAIVAEVIATTALKASQGFVHLVPSVIAVIGYGIALYLLALALKTIPVGVAYGIWCGAGIALVAIIGVVFFDQKLDATALTGLALIVVGVGLVARAV